MVQASDGSLYLGTGHRGRVYRIKAGASSLVWTADQPEIFALAVDAQGALYAGTSPDGKVYRIAQGKAAEYFAPGAKYIWSLALGRDGAEQGVLEKRGTKTLFLVGGIDSQTREHHYRNWVRHVAPRFGGHVLMSNCAVRKRIEGNHTSAFCHNVGP